MISMTSAPLSGLLAAQDRLSASAHNVANLSTGEARRRTVQAVETESGVATTTLAADRAGSALETDMVEMLEAKHSFLANLAVFRAEDEMAGTLLNTRA